MSLGKELKEFVHQCLVKDPNKRPSVKELLRSKFIRNAKKTVILAELLSQLNQSQPFELYEENDDVSVSKNKRGESNSEWEFTVKKSETAASKLESTSETSMVGTVRRVNDPLPSASSLNKPPSSTVTQKEERSTSNSWHSHSQPPPMYANNTTAPNDEDDGVDDVAEEEEEEEEAQGTFI